MIINFQDIDYDCCSDFSFKDFTGTNLSNHDLNNRIIYASCFSQEIPDSRIFSPYLNGVTFINCNLDNVFIPSGNIIISCSVRRFKAQSDGKDWLVDGSNIPLEVL